MVSVVVVVLVATLDPHPARPIAAAPSTRYLRIGTRTARRFLRTRGTRRADHRARASRPGGLARATGDHIALRQPDRGGARWAVRITCPTNRSTSRGIRATSRGWWSTP